MLLKQAELLSDKRFLPLFLTQFLGGLNQNIYKTALALLITYSLASEKILGGFLLSMAAGIFLLPFLIFSAIAGKAADKFEKSRLIRTIKLTEIILTLFAILGFYFHHTTALLFLLFLLGTQATFFAPLKYAILPEQLERDKLISANALLESSQYIAILTGTILGGIFAASHASTTLLSTVLLLFAIIGYIASFSISSKAPAAPELKIPFNITLNTKEVIQETFKNRTLALAVIGISWFWLFGATYLTHFPTYAKDVLGASSGIVTLFLIFFTAGICVGSLVCNRLLKSRIHATHVPLAALGMTLFAIDLVLASHHSISKMGEIVSIGKFLTLISSWRILLDLFLLAVCGGIYIVPLYALLQIDADPRSRGRVIACNSIFNSLFIIIGAIITNVILFLNFSITGVFLTIALANLFIAIYICNLLPDELVKSFLIWVLKLLYRVEVKGLENYHTAGKRILIIANHTSVLDAVLMAAFIPDRLTFVINTQFAQTGWMKFLLKLVNTYPVDTTNPLAVKSLIEYLRSDKRVVIFPEGRVTVTGALMKIYEAPGLIADKADAKLLPIRIDGAQYSPFSSLHNRVKIRWFPKITLTILEPRTFDLPIELSGRERREKISEKLYDIMTDTIYLSSDSQETLFESLLNAASIHGKKHLIVEDIERKPIHYGRLILGSLILGRKIARTSRMGEHIGILLPNSVGSVVTFYAFQAFHRVPALLNFTAGTHNIILACKTALVKTVYTSKRFINVADLHPIVDALTAENIQIIYLEDIRSKIHIIDKIYGKCISFLPRTYYRLVNHIKKNNDKDLANSAAVILFTSGSEGSPKGVALSHANLQANRFQMMARIDFNPADRGFNALPMFHSFGLNAGTLLPIVSGIRVFMYPSPLHYRIVPELVYDFSATILFGTDTFLSGYAKYAHPYNFYSVRYIFAGAEKLRDITRQTWTEKFGIRIFEGYGVTEASPVLATNTSMHYKRGTIGRLMPGIRHQLQTVEGIKDGGRLWVSGQNIMLGYIHSHTPGKIVPPPDGWHDTGDIVKIDDEGFITIIGRAKRFAKIAGEMISLTQIEDELYELWPDGKHAVVSKPDERKGEIILLLTSQKDANTHTILQHFQKKGVAEIALPRNILILPELPVLGSGKINYPAIKDIVENKAGIHLNEESVICTD